MTAKAKALKPGEMVKLKGHVYSDCVDPTPALVEPEISTTRSSSKRTTAPTAKKQQELDQKAEKQRKTVEKKRKEVNASKNAEARNKRALEVASVAPTTVESSSELEAIRCALAEAQGAYLLIQTA